MKLKKLLHLILSKCKDLLQVVGYSLSACTRRCLVFQQTVGALINPLSTKQVLYHDPWEQELEKKPNKTKTNGIDS